MSACLLKTKLSNAEVQSQHEEITRIQSIKYVYTLAYLMEPIHRHGDLDKNARGIM